MSDALTTDELHTAMRSLESWSTDGDDIVRPVIVPPDSQDELVASVRRLAEDSRRRVDVERSGEGVRLRLGFDGLTAADVELAAAIDQMLAGAGNDRG